MDRQYSRRQVVQGAGAVSLGLLAGCGRWPGQTQVPAKVPRIGYVGAAAPGGPNPQALADGLRELGYVEGYNLTVEWRLTEGRTDRVFEVIAELVALNVDAIVVTGATAALAAQNATRTIPIIIVMLSDPLESGFVTSLARPGGNITGLGSFALELGGKQLQLLVEVTPSAARVGVLWERRNPSRARQLKELQDAAQVLGIQIESLAVEEPHDLDSAVRAGSQARVDAIFTLQSVLTAGHKARIIELLAQAQVPAMYESSEWTEAGGLMFYGPNFPAMHRRAAYYVDKILRGAAPADLPVERPREFDFAINLKTARALGLTIPHHVLLQATEVIQ
jgi:putative tryptophan/tyrosine transport system substrate-binding protein